ncbi:MAG: glycosyl transferase [Proteobacteria bacterium]|nr:glycosyl transferase [Pseudomonadota bacterium]
MIVNEIYNGQGLGNQLANYVTTRVFCKDKNYDFGFMNYYKFKGHDFMNLDFGLPVIGGEGPEGGPPTKLPDGIKYYYREKLTRHPNGSDITIDDLELEKVQDNTKIDGNFQSETRIWHRKDEIKQWLKVKPEKDCYEYSKENICIINFRGGEWSRDSLFFLNYNYWVNAVNRMLTINPKFRFIVITDDVPLASQFFPAFEVKHFDIGTDFSIVKNAHYLIVSNSSFAYYAVLTSDTIKYILAPKYWGRHNISDGYWSCGYNIFKNHNYIDRANNLFTYDECVLEFEEYKKKNSYLWA